MSYLDNLEEMEEPVTCLKCNKWVELNETRQSSLTKKLVCKSCCLEEDRVNEWIEEAKDITYDLDSHAEHMKGDRRGWKKNLKELKEKISKAGYDYEDYS